MELFDFIERSPSPYQAADNICARLERDGFKRLFEFEDWDVRPGGGYYTVRGGSSVIAFRLPERRYSGLAVCASHTDSPSFKLKSNPELAPSGGVLRLNIEGYGGMIKESWFDRPLSAAGRIAVDTKDGIEYRAVNIDRDLLIIPSLAVHMGQAHENGKVNIQNEMLPILRTDSSEKSIEELIAEAAGAAAEDIEAYDIYLYNRQKGTVFGAGNEFIASGRLDDLQNVFASLNAFLRSENCGMLKVFAAFNNEETGSLTRQGAESTFFTDTIERINAALGISRQEYLKCLPSSLIMSADNAHAMHPNYPSKADPVNRPRLNGGVVIKYNASGRYTTDAVSAAAVKRLCRAAGVPFQEYHNRSDIAGGSTLGNLMNRHISVHSADIGLAQLAMHSAYETAGAADTEYMERFLRVFYSTDIRAERDKLVFG